MKLFQNRQYSRRLSLITGLFLLVLVVAPSLMPAANAGTLTNTFVRFNNMSTSAATTGTVCAAPATTSSGVKSWVVAFPAGFTVSGTAANWQTTNIDTTTTTGWPSGAVAWPNATAATATIAGQSVTWTNASNQTMNSGTVYCYNWTSSAAISEPASPGSSETGTITTQTSTPSTIDSGTFATATVSSNQVSVTASVSPSFSVSFTGGATDALGGLTTGAVASSSTVTFTVNTNAKNGWMAWVKDANSGLNSSSAGYTISSTATPGLGSASAALAAGTEGYNLGVSYSQTSGTCASGSAVNGNFAQGGVANKGGSFDGTLRTILTCGGTTNAGVVTPTNFAAINGATPAASDYSDTETFVAAGIF